jgi:ComF family protein
VPVQALFKKSSQFLLDLVFPPRCINCQAANSWLCEKCLGEISFIDGPVCESCGTPNLVSRTIACRQCAHNPLQFIDGIRAAAFFEDNPIRPAIHFLKYRNHKAIAQILGQLLVDTCQKYEIEADMIVPVPLHPTRLRERGYNQSELLVKEVGALLNLSVDTYGLQRIRHTRSQMKLGATERHENVVDAFAWRGQPLLGHTVLLIDDVCTTGSTLDACACALKQHGVTSVWGVTLAKAH